MEKLIIVAAIAAKETCKEDVSKALHAVTDATRTEEGNVSYTLHQDVQNPLKYTIIEEWKSQNAIDMHNDSAHFQAFKNAIDGKVDELTISVLKKIY